MISVEDRKEFIRCVLGNRPFQKGYTSPEGLCLVCRAPAYDVFIASPETAKTYLLYILMLNGVEQAFAEYGDNWLKDRCTPDAVEDVTQACRDFHNILLELFAGQPNDFFDSVWFQATMLCYRNHWLDYTKITNDVPESILKERLVHRFLCQVPLLSEPEQAMLTQDSALQKSAVSRPEVVDEDMDGGIKRFVDHVYQTSQNAVDGQPVTGRQFSHEIEQLNHVFPTLKVANVS